MIIRYDKRVVLTSELKTSHQWFYRMYLAYICPCVSTLCGALHSVLVERDSMIQVALTGFAYDLFSVSRIKFEGSQSFDSVCTRSVACKLSLCIAFMPHSQREEFITTPIYITTKSTLG